MHEYDSGEESDVDEEKLAEPEDVGKRDPALERFDQWMTVFTRKKYAKKNPDISLYAQCLSQLRVVQATGRTCPMMAVGDDGGRHVLFYNPEWLQTIGYTEFLTTMCHEALHIYGRDIPRALRRLALHPAEERGEVKGVLNVSADAANNDLLVRAFPQMKYDKAGEWIFSKTLGLPSCQSTELYFDLLWKRRERLRPLVEQALQKLMEDAARGGGEEEGEEAEGDGEGEGKTMLEQIAEAIAKLIMENAHDWGGDGVITANEIELDVRASMLDTDAKHLIHAAVSAHQKHKGYVSAHFKSILEAIKEEGVVPWSTLLRRMVQARLLSKKRRTMTRPHKRRYVFHEIDEETGELIPLDFPEPVFPGARKSYTHVILYAIDTSGSMSGDDVAEGLAEIQHLLRQEPDVHCIVVQCDTRISDVSLLGPDEDVTKYIERVGRTSAGGTMFDAPFRLARFIAGMQDCPPVPDTAKVMGMAAQYERVDLVVYHTDGESSAPPVSVHPGCPVIWCLTSSGSVPYTHDGRELFGTIIPR